MNRRTRTISVNGSDAGDPGSRATVLLDQHPLSATAQTSRLVVGLIAVAALAIITPAFGVPATGLLSIAISSAITFGIYLCFVVDFARPLDSTWEVPKQLQSAGGTAIAAAYLKDSSAFVHLADMPTWA